MTAFIYLASQSPRRRELLAQIGVRCELLLPSDDEDAEALEAAHAGEAPAAYVRRVTRLKVDAAVLRLDRLGLRPAPILCADTTVALGRTILGKPADVKEARSMLTALAGRTHRVLTAVAVQCGARRFEALSASRVTFDALTARQIASYAATGEALGKAGGYAIQGVAARHVSRISGSYSGIVGLPLFETTCLLRAAGLKI